MRARPSHARAALLCLSLALAACAKSPRELMEQAYEESQAGRYAKASLLFSKALKAKGEHSQEAQVGRARALAALKQWKDASRAALLGAEGKDAALNREARALAMQCLAQAQDRQEAHRALEAWGPEALSDPRIAAAAASMGLQAAAPSGPSAAQAGLPTRADLPEPTAVPSPQAIEAAPSPEPSPTALLAAEPTPQAQSTAVPSQATVVPQSTASAVADNAMKVEVSEVTAVDAAVPADFKALAEFQDAREVVKLASPAKGSWAWRDKDLNGYWLFLGSSAEDPGSPQAAGKNAYQISWSPDGSRLLYTAMDWASKQRHLIAYDPVSLRVRRIFKAGVELSPLASFSPDGSLIFFHYLGDLWVANADGIGRSLLDLGGRLGRPLGEPIAYAWSKDGSALAYRERGREGYVLIKLKGGR